MCWQWYSYRTAGGPLSSTMTLGQLAGVEQQVRRSEVVVVATVYSSLLSRSAAHSWVIVGGLRLLRGPLGLLARDMPVVLPPATPTHQSPLG